MPHWVSRFGLGRLDSVFLQTKTKLFNWISFSRLWQLEEAWVCPFFLPSSSFHPFPPNFFLLSSSLPPPFLLSPSVIISESFGLKSNNIFYGSSALPYFCYKSFNWCSFSPLIIPPPSSSSVIASDSYWSKIY